MTDKKREPATTLNIGVWIGFGAAFGLIFSTTLDNYILGLIIGAGLGYVMALATGHQPTENIDS